MYTDGVFDFGLPTLTNSTTPTVSPNVYNAGSAKIMFATGSKLVQVKWFTVITADASPTIEIEMRADSTADLATTPEKLGGSGTVSNDQDGTALASGDRIQGEFGVGNQLNAWQYYGLFVTLGGTNPDIVATTSSAKLVECPQTNQVFP